ncbi:YcaO-like family protein [Sorangium sp. So ce321]|uniref:YcaO-like family protein n=1 Tax=Sorangium sp. So ce321 TaxID=3133300 RepID=UPI003F6228B0
MSTARRLAPWTVARAAADGTLVLGPRLSVVQLSSMRLDTIAPGAWDELRAMGFADEPPREGPRDERPAPTASFARIAPGTATGALVAREFAGEAHALARQLDALAPERAWEVVDEPPRAPGALALVLQAVEPRRPDAARALLSAGVAILWAGECSEGLHVGPLLRSPRDLDAYLEATHGWAFAVELQRMGFAEGWPLSLVPAIRRDAAAAAAAAARVLRAPAGTCVLVDGMREVRLWTALESAPEAREALLSAQTWSKGMLADLRLERSVDVGPVWVASCRSPAGADAYLEGNFGKGTSPEEARTTAVGEAIERFGAFLGVRSEAVGEAPAGAEQYPLRCFHPFGPAYDAYCARGEPADAMTQVRDEISGRDVWAPAALVHEPYTPAPPFAATTGSTSCGLAAYTSRRGAVLRGALETLERDNFYPNFLHLRPGERIALDDLPGAPRSGDLRDLAGALRGLGMTWWLVRYPDERELPIVHAFLLDAAGAAMSRGVGSAHSWATAAVKALLEAVQLREQFALLAEEGPSSPADAGYEAWSTPEVIGEIRAYLERLGPAGRLDDLPDDDALYARLRARVGALLVKDFPCPVVGFSAVRVLIPGATCHGSASDSAGGRRLLGAAFRHPVPV